MLHESWCNGLNKGSIRRPFCLGGGVVVFLMPHGLLFPINSKVSFICMGRVCGLLFWCVCVVRWWSSGVTMGGHVHPPFTSCPRPLFDFWLCTLHYNVVILPPRPRCMSVPPPPFALPPHNKDSFTPLWWSVILIVFLLFLMFWREGGGRAVGNNTKYNNINSVILDTEWTSLEWPHRNDPSLWSRHTYKVLLENARNPHLLIT